MALDGGLRLRQRPLGPLAVGLAGVGALHGLGVRRLDLPQTQAELVALAPELLGGVAMGERGLLRLLVLATPAGDLGLERPEILRGLVLRGRAAAAGQRGEPERLAEPGARPGQRR